MRVPVVMLCETSKVHPDGRLSVTNGAPELWVLRSLPWTGGIPIVIVCELDARHESLAIEVTADVLQDDGVKVGRLRAFERSTDRDPALTTGAAPVHITLAWYLDVTLTRAGRHEVVVHGRDGQEMARCAFGVIVRPAAPDAAAPTPL